MRKIAFIILSFIMLDGMAQIGNQPGWNWPEDQALFTTTQEKQAFSRVSMQLDNYQDAYEALTWLYQNNPNLHESIYIDGVTAVEKLVQQSEDDERKAVLEDTLMILFDMRMQYFNDKKEVMGRKAYTAFKLNYNKPAKFAMLAELYDTAYVLNPDGFAYFNMTPYMTLAKYYYQRKPDEMPATRVLDIHDRISYSIEAQKKEQPDRMKREQDKIDALLSSMGEILTCEFIGEKLAPKLEANKSDLNTAKKIFSYSLKAKCTDEPFFLTAGKIVYEEDPSFELAMALGNKHLNQDETSEALTYFQKALELTDENEKLFEGHYSMAIAYTKSNNKPAARSAAYKAISVRPGDKKAYNIIGNLYFTSFNECKGGESIVQDRAIFIAAYKMYEKAGNKEQMMACKEQFPSSEEIFNEEKEVGQQITVNCWIGETVQIQRRD
jgi:tetratricopeptide (TPR) repeat protein